MKWSFNLPCIAERKPHQNPPWTLKIPQINTQEIHENQQDKRKPTDANTDTKHIYILTQKINNTSRHISKHQNSVIKYSVPEPFSKLTGHIYVILLSIEQNIENNCKDTVIFSNSLNALEAVTRKESSNQMVKQIQDLIHNADNNKKFIMLNYLQPEQEKIIDERPTHSNIRHKTPVSVPRL